jgi:hypothetical protein
MQQTGGFPSYIQSNSSGDSYNYSGLPPEIALEEQAINRKQQIANALIQRGLQPLQGQMVGGWYVPASPIQGLAQLAQAGIGADATNRNDKARAELTGKSSNMLAEAMKKYKDAIADKTTTTETQLEGPGQPIRTASPGDGFSPAELSQPTALYGTTGEALNKLDESRPSAFFKEGPRPTATSTTVTPRTPEEKRQALIEHLAISTHPQAQKIGQLMLGEMDRTEAREDTQKFQSQQNDLNRENRLSAAKEQMGLALTMATLAGVGKADLERMKEENARNLERMKLEGDRKHDETLKTIAGGHDEARQGAKVPPGYRATPDGNLEAIPGGPADTKLQGALNQDTQTLQSSISDLDRLAQSSNMLKNHAGLKGITGLRGAIPNIPGSSAADAQAQMNTLKSQIAFSVLQTMRNNSKTGGALGSVSDAEGKRLEANLAALENAQSFEQMQKSLDAIIQFTDEAKGRMSSAYNMKHKGAEPTRESSPAPSKGIRKYNPATGKIE